jgi:hypothetical protein
MDNNINNKTSPNQMRVLMKRIRDGKYAVNESTPEVKKDISIRDMLKITRKINEGFGDEEQQPNSNMETAYDQGEEEQKIRNLFNDMTVDIQFPKDALKVTKDYVIFGGIVDGVIKFVYQVTPDDNTSTVDFTYSNTFNHDNPDNDEIVKRIEGNYDAFYKYWRNNVLQQ